MALNLRLCRRHTKATRQPSWPLLRHLTGRSFCPLIRATLSGKSLRCPPPCSHSLSLGARLWDSSSLQTLHTLTPSQPVVSACWAPSKDRVVGRRCPSLFIPRCHACLDCHVCLCWHVIVVKPVSIVMCHHCWLLLVLPWLCERIAVANHLHLCVRAQGGFCDKLDNLDSHGLRPKQHDPCLPRHQQRRYGRWYPAEGRRIFPSLPPSLSSSNQSPIGRCSSVGVVSIADLSTKVWASLTVPRLYVDWGRLPDVMIGA